MPFDLLQAIEPFQTKAVALRGSTITLRAISATQMLEIESVLPAPVAPDEAEKKHPAFKALERSHFAQRCALIVGISGDIAGPGGKTYALGKTDPQWVRSYCDHILQTLTEQEVLSLWKQVGEICDGAPRDVKALVGTDTKPGN